MLASRASLWTSRSVYRLLALPAFRAPVLSSIVCRQCSSHAPEPSKSPLEQLPPDHRELGIRQELFITSKYSPGSPIFLPNGARIFNRLVEFLRKQYVRYGFDEVITPTIYKKSLWAKSGHLENYAEDMFTVTSTSPTRADVAESGNAEEEEYGLKPMNCPGHCLIFGSQTRSYRDLPIRYADFSPLHRNEISGALSGLTRVRRFHQDDGHIFCRPIQIEEEILKTLEFVRFTYGVLRLGSYRLTLSTRPDQFIGSVEDWDSAEGALKRALNATGQEWTVNEGDGAFYGPKIDIILKDSDGKEHQTATVQLDFQLPRRFELEYKAPAPELEQKGIATEDPELLKESGMVRPVMIHRAVLGSVERLMALLIEHYNGKWPFWLNPRQAIIVTVNDSQPVTDWAHKVKKTLLERQLKAEIEEVQAEGAVMQDGIEKQKELPHFHPSQLTIDIDNRAIKLGDKVRQAREKGYSVILTVGPKDVAAQQVVVDAHGIPAYEGKRIGGMKPGDLGRLMTEWVERYH